MKCDFDILAQTNRLIHGEGMLHIDQYFLEWIQLQFLCTYVLHFIYIPFTLQTLGLRHIITL